MEIIKLMNYLIKTLSGFILAMSYVMTQAAGIDALQKFNSDVNSISGNFNQSVQSKKHKQITSGTFAIQRPGLFRWEYTQPYKQTIVGDGKTVWLYDQDLAQVTKRSQNETLGNTPASILSTKTALNANYNLAEDGENNGITYVRATPKSDNADYQYIRMGFNGEQLISMQLKDSFGNLTDISFSNINLHPNFTPKQFKFTPPKGVDVLSE